MKKYDIQPWGIDFYFRLKRLTLVPIIVLMALVSCIERHDDIKAFAIDFAQKANKNQVDSVHAVYPEAVLCDSFALEFNTDSIVINTTETPNLYTVTFSRHAEMTIEKTDDGKITIIESHGLFAYPATQFELAQKTGQFNTSLNDVENAKRMADTGFEQWLKNKAKESIESLVKVTKSTAEITNRKQYSWYEGGGSDFTVKFTVEVSNETSKEIGVNEYSVLAKVSYVTYDSWTYPGETSHSVNKTLTGKPIPAKSSVIYEWSRKEKTTRHYGNSDFAVNCILNYTPEIASIMKGYIPNGNEYKEYQASKNNLLVDESTESRRPAVNLYKAACAGDSKQQLDNARILYKNFYKNLTVNELVDMSYVFWEFGNSKEKEIAATLMRKAVERDILLVQDRVYNQSELGWEMPGIPDPPAGWSPP